MTSSPLFLDESNLSLAWARAFLHIIDNRGKEISPLIVSVTGLNNGVPCEDQFVREALDLSLEETGNQQVHTVANTIFPESVYRLVKYDRHRLYELYLKTLPRYKALEKVKNRRGLYFERLIAFDDGARNSNQLEFIISEYTSRKGVRRSMLQASVFDPRRDHVRDAQLGFPCLQQISFVPQSNELTLNAFYATQQIFEKAYGNYLGLCRLGNFMAREMGLTFSRMNCVSGVEKLDKMTKNSPMVAPLIEASRRLVNSNSDKRPIVNEHGDE
jgi:hypothetical protein